MPTEQTPSQLPVNSLASSADARERLAPRIAQWASQIKAIGMDNLVGALLDAAEPLGPLGAQLLWVARPALGLFVSGDAIASLNGLADVLDDPAGVVWLRAELLDKLGSDSTGGESVRGDQ